MSALTFNALMTPISIGCITTVLFGDRNTTLTLRRSGKLSRLLWKEALPSESATFLTFATDIHKLKRKSQSPDKRQIHPSFSITKQSKPRSIPVLPPKQLGFVVFTIINKRNKQILYLLASNRKMRITEISKIFLRIRKIQVIIYNILEVFLSHGFLLRFVFLCIVKVHLSRVFSIYFNFSFLAYSFDSISNISMNCWIIHHRVHSEIWVA